MRNIYIYIFLNDSFSKKNVHVKTNGVGQSYFFQG